jgi:FtsZ-binding cell division protein ZapB
MFNNQIWEAIEQLSDSIILLHTNIEELREEVDYIYHAMGLDD